MASLCQFWWPTSANTFSCSDDEEDAISEDLDAALHSLQALTAQVPGRGSRPAPYAWRASLCLTSLASGAYLTASTLHALPAHTACGTVQLPARSPGLPADQCWQGRVCIQAGAESWGSQQAAGAGGRLHSQLPGQDGPEQDAGAI